jgi:hypothetical protein
LADGTPYKDTSEEAMAQVWLRKRATQHRRAADKKRRAAAVTRALYEDHSDADDEEEEANIHEEFCLSLEDATEKTVRISRLSIPQHSETQLTARRDITVCL